MVLSDTGSPLNTWAQLRAGRRGLIYIYTTAGIGNSLHTSKGVNQSNVRTGFPDI